MYLSDIFKFTQGLGQKGHQIGRKVGDAIELLTLGMIHFDSELTKFLVIEDGVEGATTAKHKVEFSFYNLNTASAASKRSEDLFGIIECKKVGVEQTIKANFKKWKANSGNNRDFHLTNGYTFSISPNVAGLRWGIKISGEVNEDNNLRVDLTTTHNGISQTKLSRFNCTANQQILIATDLNNQIHVLGPEQKLSEVEGHILKCIVVIIKRVSEAGIIEIHVNESLPGPQTPEKAKQASFVSLDVRKKVLGRFDKTEDQSFISVVVIGEASHWETKSRSMVRLCNDYNLFIPDPVLVYLFEQFEQKFGITYQDKITKTAYKNDPNVKALVIDILNHFARKVLSDMATGNFMTFGYERENDKNRLRIVTLEVVETLPDELSSPEIQLDEQITEE